jgi:hypothetical protein
MSFTSTLEEAPESGSITTTPPSAAFKYIADGEDDSGLVWSYALGRTPIFVPTTADILYRQDIRVSPLGYKLYEVTVPYGPANREVGSYHINFDTTGATVNVKVAREHLGSYPPSTNYDGSSAPANPHLGAIGKKLDGEVEGVDIVVPALKLNVAFKHPQGVITIAQIKNLASVTGQVSANPFLGFDAGELLYLGSVGSEGSDCETEVAYQFAGSANNSSLTFGAITDVVKPGWAYAWVDFLETINSGGEAVTIHKRVNVERVYDAVDFAGVFGWGG